MNAALTPLRSLLKNARLKHFEQGQTLLYAEDAITENYILKSGIVKVFDIDSKGDEKILQITKAPALLPIDCLLSSPDTISWHYGALTDVEVCVFSPEELHSKITSVPDLSSYIINWLAVESHELMVRINGMSKSDAKDKILTILRFLNVYYTGAEKRGWKRIEFPLTHQLMADIAGITRESTTIQMGHLQNEKVIRSRRPYIEINVQRLAKYSQLED
jgi:CRP/FNR family transcriptional regulator